MLISDLWPCLPSSLIPLGFPNEKMYAFLFSLMYATCLAHLILLDVISWIIFCKDYKLWSFLLGGFLQYPLNSAPVSPNIFLTFYTPMAVSKMIAVFSVCHRAVWLLFTSVVLLSQIALLVTSYQTAWRYMPEGSHFNESTIFSRLETHIFWFLIVPRMPINLELVSFTGGSSQQVTVLQA